MTVFGRDASNFDGSISYAGLGYFTHKATEGTSITHDRYGPRLDAARAAGVPVLGSYHVVRTPGNGGAGTLAQQLAYWLAYLDAHTPWWRSHPQWMMQIDAEKWSYDTVSATTAKQFAALLVQSGVPGYKVTYASRGQYADSLSGIVTDLWNADYNGGPNYPGDGWTPGWGPYSGKTPRFLQYAAQPYDEDAYRGTLAELLALTATPNGDSMAFFDDSNAKNMAYRIADIFASNATQSDGTQKGEPNLLKAQLDRIEAAVKAAGTLTDAQVVTEADRIAAALIASPRNALTAADHAAIKADLVAVLNAKLQAAAGG